MNQEKTTLEIIAPTVDEAIERGLEQLSVPRASVEIDVLDQGSRGLFGIGSRQARIRLSLKPQPIVEEKYNSNMQAVTPETPKKSETPSMKSDNESQAAQSVPDLIPLADMNDEALTLCQKVANELLEKMNIRAKVTTQYVQDEDEKGQKTILINVQGNDLSILIGKRSETLNALQYMTSLIVNKEIGRMVPISIDIQGYRSRRERQLRQLARRMADQAVKSGRRQILEPMPANERRLLHMELRDHPDVITESIGEEPYRKVTIKLRKNIEAGRKSTSDNED